MVTEEWKDKDGNQQSRTICNVEKINFCGPKGGTQQTTQSKSSDGFMNIPDGIDEEMPFN